MGADDVLVAVALKVNHVVVLLELVELDIDEDPDSVRDAGYTDNLRGRRRCGDAAVVRCRGFDVFVLVLGGGGDTGDVEPPAELFEVAAAVVDTG